MQGLLRHIRENDRAIPPKHPNRFGTGLRCYPNLIGNKAHSALMGYGDVWVLGAGASAEAGAPTVPQFKRIAEELRLKLESDEREAFDSVLGFWDTHARSLNIEQFFGYVDSPALVRATHVVSPHQDHIDDVRRKTLYLIAKVIAVSLGRQVSDLHEKFAENFIKRGGDTITFNWDITLDRAMVSKEARVDYSFPKPSDWGKTNWYPHTLLKLHGSLNWKFCRECNCVDPLDEKETATDWFLGKSALVCGACGRSDNTEVLMIPPVLTKLADKSSVMTAIWKRAFEVLRGAKQVFIIGYSFPETDLQSRVLISRGLTESKDLEQIFVVTKPKFGSERQRFEDRYIEALAHSGKRDKVRFEYDTFREFVLRGGPR